MGTPNAHSPSAESVEFTPEQIDRLGHWLSECLDDAAPLNERIWRSRAEWMVKGPTFQSVMREIVNPPASTPEVATRTSGEPVDLLAALQRSIDAAKGDGRG